MSDRRGEHSQAHMTELWEAATHRVRDVDVLNPRWFLFIFGRCFEKLCDGGCLPQGHRLKQCQAIPQLRAAAPHVLLLLLALSLQLLTQLVAALGACGHTGEE